MENCIPTSSKKAWSATKGRSCEPEISRLIPNMSMLSNRNLNYKINVFEQWSEKMFLVIYVLFLNENQKALSIFYGYPRLGSVDQSGLSIVWIS
jgi:hypothetical protein